MRGQAREGAQGSARPVPRPWGRVWPACKQADRGLSLAGREAAKKAAVAPACHQRHAPGPWSLHEDSAGSEAGRLAS